MPLAGPIAKLSRRCVLDEIGQRLGPPRGRQARLRSLWGKRAAELAKQPVCDSDDWVSAARNCTPWSLAATKPSARFCRLSWVCPFCYGRAVSELWQQVRGTGFSLEIRTLPLLPFAIDQPWDAFVQGRRKLVAGSKGAVCWQWLLPRAETLELRLVAVLSGGRATEEDFVTALAYPAGWLFGDARLAAYCFWYMRHKRGRAAFGNFRGDTL